jgi:hypothetical protein
VSEAIIECPSGLKVKVRNLKVKEIAKFSDRKAVKSGEVFDTILKECTTEVIDPGIYTFSNVADWDQVLQGDRFYALLRVRATTYGEAFEFDVQCHNPRCNAVIKWSLPLCDLPVKPFPKESLERVKEKRDFETTIFNKKATFQLITGATMRRNMKALRNNDDAIVDSLALRFLTIEGVAPHGKRAFFEDLDANELASIRASLDEADGGVETNIEVECGSCAGVSNVELPFGQEFWAPKIRSKR